MAVPTTWAELKAEVANLSLRDDMTDLIPNFIGYAEALFQTVIFSPEREEVATLTVTNGVAALPADFSGIKTVYVDGDVDRPLLPLTPDRLRALYPTADTGTPIHYAVEGETMIFGPIPASGTVIKLRYVEAITPLGESQATNWLLTDHPGVYVQGALAELYAYLRDGEAQADAEARRNQLIDLVNIAGRRRKTNSGPLVANSPVVQANRYARC